VAVVTDKDAILVGVVPLVSVNVVLREEMPISLAAEGASVVGFQIQAILGPHVSRE